MWNVTVCITISLANGVVLYNVMTFCLKRFCRYYERIVVVVVLELFNSHRFALMVLLPFCDCVNTHTHLCVELFHTIKNANGNSSNETGAHIEMGTRTDES